MPNGEENTAVFWNKTVKRRTAKWLYGLVSGFIGGGAGSAAAAISACVIKPESFNFNAGMGATLKLAAATFLVTGLTHAFAFLQQSPLPGPTGDTEHITKPDAK